MYACMYVEGGREGGRDGRREGEKEGGREGGREGEILLAFTLNHFQRQSEKEREGETGVDRQGSLGALDMDRRRNGQETHRNCFFPRRREEMIRERERMSPRDY